MKEEDFKDTIADMKKDLPFVEDMIEKIFKYVESKPINGIFLSTSIVGKLINSIVRPLIVEKEYAVATEFIDVAEKVVCKSLSQYFTFMRLIADKDSLTKMTKFIDSQKKTDPKNGDSWDELFHEYIKRYI